VGRAVDCDPDALGVCWNHAAYTPPAVPTTTTDATAATAATFFQSDIRRQRKATADSRARVARENDSVARMRSSATPQGVLGAGCDRRERRRTFPGDARA